MPKRVAVVEVTLTGGKVLSERVEAERGAADNPITRDEVAAKARELMTPVLGAPTTAKLIERIFRSGKREECARSAPLGAEGLRSRVTNNATLDRF
jgi:2-methylcitrate dehydratase PrpD